MKVKVCYNEEIHRISNLPEAFEDLVKLIPGIFHSQLPESWTLQYKDSDGDNILITDEKDYEEFKNSEPGTASAISKIHVISAESFRANNAVVNKPDVIQLEASEIKREEDYQVIEGEDKEENEDNQPEEMIEVKEEVPEAVPVQEEQDKAEPKEIEEKDEIIKESEVQEEPREPEEQQDEQEEEQERKEPEEPEKAEEQDDVKAPEELHEPEEVMEKEVQEEKEEKEEEPKVYEPEVEEEEVRYFAPIQVNKQPIEEEPRVQEEELPQPAEEKVVEEEQKSNVMESQYSKILAPRENKMQDSYEVLGSKILIGANDLKSLVSSIIEQKMPEISQFTQQQIEEQRSQMSQSMIADQSLLISDEFRPKPVAPKIMHYDTKCMGCGMAPIQGIRYKCTICPSFDYCEQCEEAGTHPHNFVKMRQRDVQDIFRPPQQFKPVASVLPEWKKNEKEMKEEPVNQKPVNQKPGQDAKHFNKLMETAKKLQKCFPKEDFDMLCVFINDCPEDMSIEELVENYKLGLKKD